MMHEMQIENAYRQDGRYDFTPCLSLLQSKLSAADLAVANMEFSLGGKPYTGYPAFSAPDEIALYAAESGIDVFLAANNHIYDRGLSGVERTLNIYRGLGESHGVRFTGIAEDETEYRSNSPLICNVNGRRIAFLNFTYGTNGGIKRGWPKVSYMDDKEEIENAMKKSAKGCDAIFVLPHWGNEYELTHSDEQEDTAEWLAEKGADYIIGTHPHVVQDTTSIHNDTTGNRTHIAYSLGNAISNMSARNTQLELRATCRIVRHSNGDIEHLPMEIEFLWCSRPGGFNGNYTVIPVKEYIGKKELWKSSWDYDNMISTYIRVKETTGITDTL